MVSSLYVDDDGYICLDQTIDRNVALQWVLHRMGWEVYLGDFCVYTFDDNGYTYPKNHMFKTITTMMSYFRYITPSGMWEVSYIDDETVCREHKLFDEFEDAFSWYESLVMKGKI